LQTDAAENELVKPNAPRIYFLTGMHRSGTSFLAARMLDAGIAIPGPHLPANDDNPEGYWEARSVVDLNNRMLVATGQDWQSIAPIDPEQLAALNLEFSDEVEECLGNLLSSAGSSIGVKDPRFCRTLPVWCEAARKLGATPEIIATVRSAADVAKSLYRRRRRAEFRPAAVDLPGQSLLLWLRYMTDMEVLSRPYARRFIRFSDLAALDPHSIRKFLSLDEVQIAPHLPGAIEAPTTSWQLLAEEVENILANDRTVTATVRLDQVRQSLDRELEAAGEDRPEVPRHLKLARAVARQATSAALSVPVISFVSGEPEGRGHIYRIENRIYSLIDTDVSIVRADPRRDNAEDIAAVSDLIVVFRKPMDQWLDVLIASASRRGKPVIFDIDDLLFEPDLMRPEIFRYLEGKPSMVRADWEARARGYALAASAATACWVSTAPLAERIARLNRKARVLPNGFVERPGRRAGDWAEEAESDTGERDRTIIGYASGTPTHDRDFLEAAEAIALTLEQDPGTCLEIIGELSENSLRGFAHLDGQIVRRPVVDFYQLPARLKRFDVNIAPLERDNVFCDCKSELKYFEAARLGVPSIASPTRPFAACIQDGNTGLLAAETTGWADALSELTGSPARRRELGLAAKEQANAQFGPEAQKRDLIERIQEFLPGFGRRQPAGFRQKKEVTSEAGFSLIEVMVGLAITAVISVLIFSSLISQVRQADIVRTSTQSAFSDIASRRLVETVVSTTTPSWSDETRGQFSGDGQNMSGMSAFSLFGKPARLQDYSLTLAPSVDETVMLTLTTEDGEWQVEALPAGARFRYLGGDATWYDSWPQSSTPGRTVAEMERFFTNQGLPRMICIWSDGTGGPVDYQISFENNEVLPARTRDLGQTLP